MRYELRQFQKRKWHICNKWIWGIVNFLFVCCDHRLFTPVSIPRGWIFACMAIFPPATWAAVLVFREVHAGYVSVAGTDVNCWTLASVSFKSEHDFVHAHSK